jgi:hypothetical protein
MSSISNITTSAHAALSSRGATSTASAELHKLVAKLHLDAIPSASASGTASASSTASDKPTGLVSSFRELFDGALDAAKDARAAAKTVTSATHGAGLAGLAATAVGKIL